MRCVAAASLPPIVLVPSSAGMGGLEGHVIQLGRGLVERGMRVAAVCLPREDLAPMRAALAAAGVRVHVLPSRVGSPLAPLRRLAMLVRSLRQYPGAIVHLHYGGYGGGELVQLAAWLAGARAVVRTEHVPPVPPFTRRGRLLVKVRDRFLARIICVAEQNRREHIQRLGRDPRQFVVVPNGIDVLAFSPTAETGPAVRHELGIEAAAPLIGTVARLSEARKGIDLFVAMAADMAAAAPTAHFLVIGEGDLRPGLERQAEQLGMADRVHFLGERSDVRRLLAALQVFVMPSWYEAGPLTVLEALAMARPVVSTPVGLVPEVIVADGQGGRLVPVGDSHAMAKAVLELLADPAAAQRLAETGRQQVLTHYSLDAMVEQTIAVYRSVLPKRR